MSIHAIRRARERYDLDLTFEDLSKILNEILDGNCKEISHNNIFGYRDENCKHYRLRFRNKLIEPVVKKDSDGNYMISTFWPTGKRADRFLKKWLNRFKDENWVNLMKKYGKDKNQ